MATTHSISEADIQNRNVVNSSFLLSTTTNAQATIPLLGILRRAGNGKERKACFRKGEDKDAFILSLKSNLTEGGERLINVIFKIKRIPSIPEDDHIRRPLARQKS